MFVKLSWKDDYKKELITILKISFQHEQPISKQNYFSFSSAKQEAKFTNDLPKRRNFN